jgi:hypothetical protein
MFPRFCNIQNAGKDDVRFRVAEGSDHLPTYSVALADPMGLMGNELPLGTRGIEA